MKKNRSEEEKKFRQTYGRQGDADLGGDFDKKKNFASLIGATQAVTDNGGVCSFKRNVQKHKSQSREGTVVQDQKLEVERKGHIRMIGKI